MIYLDSFCLSQEKHVVYPYKVLTTKGLEFIKFAPITIFYGNNGSGKSTLLNVIADGIGLSNKSLGNTNEYFNGYVKKCSHEFEHPLPAKSRLIRSEDIMGGIIQNRKDNYNVERNLQREIKKNKLFNKEFEFAQKIWEKLSNNPLDLTEEERFFASRCSLQDNNMAGITSARAEMIEEESNGETALNYFKDMLLPDAMFLLDEPENSMSPKFQDELRKLIHGCACYLNCQFIIATHSPFLLSMPDSKIYDLDSYPVQEKRWFDLENIKIYYDLFKKNERFFETEPISNA